MSVKVVEGDIEVQRDVLIGIIRRLLRPDFDSKLFHWLYKDNPFGQANVWMAIENKSEEIIGTATAFARRFYVGNREVCVWVLGDFCLDAQYRSLGPALQLQRTCLGVLEANNGMFCYDFPSSSMLAVYKRLGFSVTGRMLRLAKLLRVDRKAREIAKSPLVGCAVAAVGNVLLRALSAARLVDASLELSAHHGPFGEEFSILDREQRGRLGIRAQRSAEYLNWRYLHNPLGRYEVITARRGGELKGYAVWTQSGDDASVVDLFGENDSTIAKGLLSKIMAILRNRAVMTLSICVNEGHPWFSWYTDMGFRIRDSAPMVCVPSPSFANKVDFQAAKWFLMQGDRDS